MSKKKVLGPVDDGSYWQDDLPTPDLDAPQSFNLDLMPSAEEFRKMVAEAETRAARAKKRSGRSSPIQEIMRKSLRLNHPQLTEEEIEDLLLRM